jgi:response regulator RpfG family c-di-GMP phosphodiesterase
VSAIANRPSVLIVDDERMIRELLGDVFTAGGYQCRLASNGVEAIEAFQAERPALSVTDIRMPVLDGLGFLKQARTLDPDAAVLVLTGVGDVQTAVDVLNGGAYDFIQKPVDPEHLLLTAGRALEHRQLVIERRQHQELLERRVTEATSELASTVRHLEETYRVTIEALGSAIDTRDVGTHAHSRRVRGYSLAIARAHGVPESQMPDIEHGVMLHDIGKIGIPDAILLKPGPLTPEEWTVMRSHPEIGRRLVEKIPFLRGAISSVYHHHERWDGTGYPLGLRGEGIPLEARIFAIADALDAMTFDRPYSRAISFETARDEIKRCVNTHFDPAVVDTFLTIPLQTFVDIRHRSLNEMSAADAAAEAVRTALGNSGSILESALLV